MSTAYKFWKLKQILNKLYSYSSYRQYLIWKWTGDISFKQTEKKTKKTKKGGCCWAI